MSFWWPRVAFNSSISDSKKILHWYLLEMLYVNPWEIPVALGENFMVLAESSGRLHHCCHTMIGSVNTWKWRVRESRPSDYAQTQVSSQCVFHVPSQLLPLWLQSRLKPSSYQSHGVLAWLTHWLCDWCGFPLSEEIFKCLHQDSNQPCTGKTKSQQNDIQALNIIHK